MREVTLGALVVLVAVAGVVLLTVWNANSDSPVAVAQRMVRGLEQHDEAGLKRVFCDPDLAGLVLSASPPGVRFAHPSYRQAPDPATGVMVTITGHMELPDGAGSEAVTWRLRLHKAGDAWCIVGFSTAS